MNPVLIAELLEIARNIEAVADRVLRLEASDA
jgi:hypothetical protein